MQQDFCVPKMLQLFTVVKEMFICKNTSLLKCVQLFTNQQRKTLLSSLKHTDAKKLTF